MDESVIEMFLEQILFNSVTKEIDIVRVENAELKRSLEFSQTANNTLKWNVTQLQSAMKRIEDLNISQGVGERFRKIEDNKRSKNLRVTGVTENINENRGQTELKVKIIKTTY